MDLNQYYQSGRYKSPHFRERSAFLNKRIAWIQKELQIPFSGKVLDVGCGDGTLLFHLKSSNPTLELFGTDISKAGCKLAIKMGIKAKAADLNYKIPFGNAKFDFIIGHESIEHLWNTDKFLSECHRCLKKGGYLILATPNLAAWYNRILILLGIHSLFAEMSTIDRRVGLGIIKILIKNTQPLGHIRIFTISALKDLANLSGFEVKKIKGSSFSFNTNFIFIFFSVLDYLFSFITSFSSDLLIILKKSK